MRRTAFTSTLATLIALCLSGCNSGFGSMFADNMPKLPSWGWGKNDATQQTALAAAQPQYQPAMPSSAAAPAVAMNPGYMPSYPSTGAAAYASQATTGGYPNTAGGYGQNANPAPGYGNQAGSYSQATPYNGYSTATTGASPTTPQEGYYNPGYSTSGAISQEPPGSSLYYGNRGSATGQSSTSYGAAAGGAGSYAAPNNYGTPAASQSGAGNHSGGANSSSAAGYSSGATTAQAPRYGDGAATRYGGTSNYNSGTGTDSGSRYSTGSAYDSQSGYGAGTGATPGSGSGYPNTPSFSEERYMATPSGNYERNQTPPTATSGEPSYSSNPASSGAASNYYQRQSLTPAPGQPSTTAPAGVPSSPITNPHYRPGGTGDYVPPGGAQTNPSGLPGRSLSGLDVAPAGYAPSGGTTTGRTSAPVYVPPASTAPMSGRTSYSGSSTRG